MVLTFSVEFAHLQDKGSKWISQVRPDLQIYTELSWGCFLCVLCQLPWGTFYPGRALLGKLVCGWEVK